MSRSNVAIALVCETQDLGRHLRDALASLGTPIVYESAPTNLDLVALENSGARVVVVNLDPEVEAHLDDVHSLLEDERYSVVFNDAQASSGLSGWDQARWARHLAAKILGDFDIDPPRPEGAEAVPEPLLAARAPGSDVPSDEDEGDVLELAAERDAPSPAAEAIEEPVHAAGEDPTGLLESRYTEMSQPAASAFPSPPPPPDEGFDFSTLEALTAAPLPPRTPEPEADSDVAGVILPEASWTEEPESAASFELIEMSDLDESALEGPSLGESALESAALDDSVPGESVIPAPPRSTEQGDVEDPFDLGALDALLADVPAHLPTGDEPVDDDAPAIESGIESFAIEDGAEDTNDETNHLSTPGLSLADDIGFDAPSSPDDKPSAMPSLAAAVDWSLEDMIEGEPASPPPREAASNGPADFGIEKLTAAEYLAPPTEGTAPPVPDLDLDFSLELMPIEEAVAPQAIEREASETWLDPDQVRMPAKIRRVVVLGASIGGPEAVREFLGELPRDYPALFLLAQHMGAEFVDLMAQQLAKKTSLTVRMPSHGERVGHGDVVIVPTTHRLQVDPEGVVVLERVDEDGAYSPSIDRVLRDVADRYGSNAGAIIFSGMTTDAVEGSKYLAGKGGAIYAQHPDSCVVSSMIEGVMDAGIVRFLGAPRELAERMIAEAAKSAR
ncbi:MAG TPA: chemotaxis protein CheB [Rhodanobacteraceae bacterium]|nr:chemotaxis protein CheB [Rhodanobacteraceae bacterium]